LELAGEGRAFQGGEPAWRTEELVEWVETSKKHFNQGNNQKLLSHVGI
jgi:hypothetical protein